MTGGTTVETMNGPAVIIILAGIIFCCWLLSAIRRTEEVSTKFSQGEQPGRTGTRPGAIPVTQLDLCELPPGFERRLDEALARVVANPEDADDVADEVRTMLEDGTAPGEAIAVDALFDLLVTVAMARVYRARFRMIGGGLNVVG